MLLIFVFRECMVSLFISVFFSCACRKCLDYQLVPEVMIFFICIKKYIYIYIYFFFPTIICVPLKKMGTIAGRRTWKRSRYGKTNEQYPTARPSSSPGKKNSDIYIYIDIYIYSLCQQHDFKASRWRATHMSRKSTCENLVLLAFGRSIYKDI